MKFFDAPTNISITFDRFFLCSSLIFTGSVSIKSSTNFFIFSGFFIKSSFCFSKSFLSFSYLNPLSEPNPFVSLSNSTYLSTTSSMFFSPLIKAPVSDNPLLNTYTFLASPSLFRLPTTSISPFFRYFIESTVSTYFLPLFSTTSSLPSLNRYLFIANVLASSYLDLALSFLLATSLISLAISESISLLRSSLYHCLISATAASNSSPLYFASKPFIISFSSSLGSLHAIFIFLY